MDITVIFSRLSISINLSISSVFQLIMSFLSYVWMAEILNCHSHLINVSYVPYFFEKFTFLYTHKVFHVYTFQSRDLSNFLLLVKSWIVHLDNTA